MPLNLMNKSINLIITLVMLAGTSWGSELNTGAPHRKISSAADSLPPIHKSEPYLDKLKVMAEKPLDSSNRILEIYRIVWDGKCVRYQSDGKNFMKRTVLLTPNLLTIESQSEEAMTRKEWKRVQNEINATGFWTLPSRDREGYDGYAFSMEGLSQGNHHSVYVWSPLVRTKFEEFCRKEIGRLNYPSNDRGKYEPGQ